MTSTASYESAHTPPWGTAFAMAGAMAAGLATGRSGKLVLVAGIAAAAGLKWILRRSAAECSVLVETRPASQVWVPGKSSKLESADCCVGAEKSPEPAMRAAAGAMLVGPSAVDEELPVIWEQGRGASVSSGAVGAQTVWFEMHEPIEAIPAGSSSEQITPGAVPAAPVLTGMNDLPESFFCEAPGGNPDSLPALVAMAGESEAGLTSAFANLHPLFESTGLSRFVPQPRSGESAGVPGSGLSDRAEVGQTPDELGRGPHRSVVPQAPVDDRSGGRWMMLATAVVLVIVALALVLDAFQQDGWISGLKQRWQMKRSVASEFKEKDAWPSALPGEK